MIKGDPYVILLFFLLNNLDVKLLLRFQCNYLFFWTGQVIYRSRYLQGDTYNANMSSKRIVVSEMGTMAYPDPNKNFIVK